MFELALEVLFGLLLLKLLFEVLLWLLLKLPFGTKWLERPASLCHQ